jgi:hypothetical protein
MVLKFNIISIINISKVVNLLTYAMIARNCPPNHTSAELFEARDDAIYIELLVHTTSHPGSALPVTLHSRYISLENVSPIFDRLGGAL